MFPTVPDVEATESDVRGESGLQQLPTVSDYSSAVVHTDRSPMDDQGSGFANPKDLPVMDSAVPTLQGPAEPAAVAKAKAEAKAKPKAKATAADDAAEAGDAPTATAAAPAAGEQPSMSTWPAASAAQWPPATGGSMDASLAEGGGRPADVPGAHGGVAPPSLELAVLRKAPLNIGGVNLEDSGDEMDASGVDKEVEDDLLGVPAESSAREWGPAVEDASDFVVAKGVDPLQVLDIRPVSDSPIERLGLHIEDAKKNMFPEYLQPLVWQRLGASKALANMQAMKERALEHVRWRSTSVQVPDVQFHCMLHRLKSDLELWCRSEAACNEMGHLETVFCQGDVKPEDFLKIMNGKSLNVTQLKQEDQQSQREGYQVLLSKFPTITIEKVGHEQLQTIEGQAKTLTQLVNKHSGELVELEADAKATRGGWRLVSGSHDQFELGEQWFCIQGGKAVGPGDIQKEWKPSKETTQEEDREIICVLSQEPSSASSQRLSRRDLQPDWDGQQYRVTVPCVGTKRYCWVRMGAVITLGQLFLILGTACKAKLLP